MCSIQAGGSLIITQCSEKGAEVFYEVVECLRWYGVLGSIVKLVVLENVLLQRPATLVLLREGVEGGPNACSVECRKNDLPGR